MILFFYLFSFLIISSSIGVIVSKNPVHSVLWLIFAFCNSAGLFILLNAEFLAFLLIIVYVGAVAVLFLFVIMMLDLKYEQKSTKSYGVLGKGVTYLVGSLFLLDLAVVMFINFKNYDLNSETVLQSNKIALLGKLMYVDYVLPFQMAGLVLLIAMVGCIVLTLKKKKPIKRQSHTEQLAREIKDCIKVIKIETISKKEDPVCSIK